MFHQTVLDHLTVLAGAIPKVNTQAPPGSEKILSIVGFVKWIAGAGIIACFLGGIVAFTAGRMFDHHRTGRMGLIFMMAAGVGAMLFAVGPDAYAAAYTAVAAPGAPAVEATPLHRGLVEIRARSGLRTTGAVPGLTFSWTPGGGLIKGSTDRGRYVVACVIGQLDSGAHGQILSTGAGDCQALRFVDGQWWISPGAAAAPAPLAWPGSAAAAQAGYRAVTDAA